MRQFFRRLFLENLALKLVALVLAVTLYVLVRGEKDAHTGAFVKVIYTYRSDRVLMTDPPDRVRVSIRGPWSRINRLDENGLEPIHVDLAGVTSGDFKFQEDMVKLPPGLRVASFSPASVRLDFEPRVTRTVPVNVNLEGAPAAGYRIESTEAEPAAVSLSGAQSVVDRLARVSTEVVRVGGAHGPVVRVVGLQRLPRHAELVEENRVRVVVRIAPEIGERILLKVPVTVIGGPSPAKVEPPAVDVVVRGPRAALDALTTATVIARVDVQEIGSRQGSYSRRIQVGGLAEGLSADARPGTVVVTLGRRPGGR